MSATIQKADVGTVLELTIQDQDGTGIDVSAAAGLTVKQIKLLKPDGTAVTKTAAYKTDGTDFIIQYVTIAGDLDAVGMWKIQALLTFGSSPIFHTEAVAFVVFPNLS